MYPKDGKGMGTSLTKIKNGSETADWKIGSLLSIGEVKLTIGEEDITTLDSPDRAKEFMPGDVEAGELGISGIIKKQDDENTVSKMMALIQASSIESWIVEFPSGATWVFEAFVKEFGTGEVSTEGMINFNGTLRISGLPVWTAAV